MRDVPNKLMFLAATGVMWAVLAYGAQLDSQWFGPKEETQTAQASAFLSATPALFASSARAARSDEEPLSTPAKGSASVLPDSASCPSPGALVSPPSTDKLIGKEGPSVTKGAPAQAPNNANLGTGSACPPPRADAERARTPELRGSGLGLPQNAQNNSGR